MIYYILFLIPFQGTILRISYASLDPAKKLVNSCFRPFSHPLCFEAIFQWYVRREPDVFELVHTTQFGLILPLIAAEDTEKDGRLAVISAPNRYSRGSYTHT